MKGKSSLVAMAISFAIMTLVESVLRGETLNAGSNARLQCLIHFKTGLVQWYKRNSTSSISVISYDTRSTGNPVYINPRWSGHVTIHSTFTGFTYISLILKYPRDNGVFYCILNQIHRACSFKITLTGGPGIKLSPLDWNYAVLEKQPFVISATSDSPAIIVRWRKGKRLDRKNPYITNSGVLKFEPATRQNSGYYTVVATGSSGNSSRTIQISVKNQPNIRMYRRGNSIVCESHGDYVVFTGFVQEVEYYKIRDMKYKQSTINGKKPIIQKAVAQYRPKVLEDSGTYTCTVKNDVAYASASITINPYSPPIITERIADVDMCAESTLYIPIPFYSVPKYTELTWTESTASTIHTYFRLKFCKRCLVCKTNIKFRFHGVEVTKSGSLFTFVIRKASGYSSGSYKLKIKNELGSVETTVHVKVRRDRCGRSDARDEGVVMMRVIVAAFAFLAIVV